MDVAIVGAGVSGALMADALLNTGKTVAVFDRRGPIRGATAASTALLQFELDQPLVLLSKALGRERAARAYWRSASSVSYLRGRIQDLGLRSAFRERSTVYLPGNVLDIQTSEGFEVRARHAVFATGYEPLKILNMKGHRIISTWAMATPPQAERLWPSRALIWEASDPYLYMRTTSDDRIVVGGCDEKFSDEEKRDSLIPTKIAAIGRKLSRLLPDVQTHADFAWTGSFGASATGMPSMGVVPGAKRCFAVLGYGGNGITFSTVAAQLVQRAIMGIKDPDEDLFAFTA